MGNVHTRALGLTFRSFKHGWVSATSSPTPTDSPMATLCLFICLNNICCLCLKPSASSAQSQLQLCKDTRSPKHGRRARTLRTVWLPIPKSSSFSTFWHSNKSACSVFIKQQVRTSYWLNRSEVFPLLHCPKSAYGNILEQTALVILLVALLLCFLK